MTPEEHPPTQGAQPHPPPDSLTPEVVSTPPAAPPATSNVSTHPSAPQPSVTTSEAPPHNVGSNPPPTTETPSDPKVAALLSMFPDFDTFLLQSVLESVGGDQDRAVDVLLGMSDPSYTSTERADRTQTELDEEIARRLMLEETEQQQRQPAWQPQGPDVPYQARSHAAPHPQGQHSSQQRPAEGDGMAQFQEQLGKIAETGKKTFSTFLSKVKAKMQEYDNPPGQGQSSNSTNPLPGGDSWNTPAQSQSYYEPNPPRVSEGYDVGGTVPHTSISQSPPSTAAQPVSMAQPSLGSTTTSSPSAGAPISGNVDPSKIGLLPKRPVSLGSSPQPSGGSNDDEVEYVENPFEESAHRR